MDRRVLHCFSFCLLPCHQRFVENCSCGKSIQISRVPEESGGLTIDPMDPYSYVRV